MFQCSDPPGVAPGSPACGAGVVLLEHEPKLGAKVHPQHAPKDLNPDQLSWSQSCCHYTRDACCVVDQRKPWDSNPQAVCQPRPVSNGFLIQPDDFRESNPQGSNRPSRFERTAHRHLACPFRKAAAAGIEPASAQLTAAHPYQHGNHRITSVRTAGFEPAISCAKAGGLPGFPTS